MAKETTRVKEHGKEKPAPYPAEEQGIEPEPTEEQKDLEMETGQREEEPYDEEGRENLTEDAEMTPREQAFMEGYEEKGEHAKCANCGKILGESNTVERRINGELVWFCSEKCAQEYARKKK